MNKVTNQMKNPFHHNCLPFIDVWSNHLGAGGILLLVHFENQTHQKRKAKIALTRQSKHCGFYIYIFDDSFDQSKSMVRLVWAEKMVWFGLCAKDSQDDFDSEYIGFDGSPDD